MSIDFPDEQLPRVYLITMLEPAPTGVEYMGAQEIGLEPVIQQAATADTVMQVVDDMIGRASRRATDANTDGVRFDFSRRQHVIESVGALTADHGGRVQLPSGEVIAVQPADWQTIVAFTGAADRLIGEFNQRASVPATAA